MLQQSIPLMPAESPAAARGGRFLRVGGLTPFTSIDFPGRLSAVVFVQGCPLRCTYCHNPHLQTRHSPVDGAPHWTQVREWLSRRQGLIDAVVFSGGEPTVDPMLPDAMRETRALGFAIGLHSAGTHPRRLAQVLPLMDWIGLDIKAPLDDSAAYDRLTGIRGSAASASACLNAVLDSGVDYEVRTTAHPLWLSDAALVQLTRDLKRRGVRNHVLQIARSTARQPAPHMLDYPRGETIEFMSSCFDSFSIRRD